MRGFATLVLVCLADMGQALAHAPAMHTDEATGVTWNPDPWLLTSLGLVAVFYAVGARRLARRAQSGARRQRYRAVAFAAGWLVLCLALLSPVDTLGERLFSVHMVQHELLMLIAAPLLVLAAPGGAFAWSLPAAGRRAVARGLLGVRGLWHLVTQPLAAWTLNALVLWAWHAPGLFQAGLEDAAIHTLQHLSFFIATVAFWFSLVNRAAGPGVAMLSLFTTAAHASLLGALLTFAPTPWYAAYLDTTAAWGFTPLEDQQLGGLIMWVPGCVTYLVAALWLLARWLERGDQKVRRRQARMFVGTETLSP